jgi:hypothetical protein
MEILPLVSGIDISYENQVKNEHRFYGRLNARTRASFLDDINSYLLEVRLQDVFKAILGGCF